MKTIHMVLSTASIRDAIQEVRTYKKSIEAMANKFCEILSERIQNAAQSGYNSSVVDLLTEKSGGGGRPAEVAVYTEKTNTGYRVVAKGEDAVFVEFGAGVNQNGAVGSSPNPKGAELGLTIGSYGKGRGKQQAWAFYDGGELQWTYGTKATMPLYNAMQRASEELIEVAKEVFAD